jgi:hypothetical protein
LPSLCRPFPSPARPSAPARPAGEGGGKPKRETRDVRRREGRREGRREHRRRRGFSFFGKPPSGPARRARDAERTVSRALCSLSWHPPSSPEGGGEANKLDEQAAPDPVGVTIVCPHGSNATTTDGVNPESERYRNVYNLIQSRYEHCMELGWFYSELQSPVTHEFPCTI